MGVVKKCSLLQLPVVLLPALLAAQGVMQQRWYLALGGLPAVLLAATLPVCRKRESMWVFFMTFLVSVPLNLGLLGCLRAIGYLEAGFWLTGVLLRLLVCFLLFSAEELACGIAARLIWKHQLPPLLTQAALQQEPLFADKSP